MSGLTISFWDVGQGDCSTITLPSGRVILIDVGPRGCPVVDWLADLALAVETVVLTHNDMDHVGALPELVGTLGPQVRGLHMLQDRPIGDKRFDSTFRCALEGQKRGYYTIRRLEAGDIIWSDSNIGAELAVVFPRMSDNVSGMASGPNRTSAILVLRINGKVEVVWPGDASLESVAEFCLNTQPLALVGPHHGAPDGYRLRTAKAHIESVQPRSAFISVGSRNRYHHPRRKYLLRLELAGCAVTCSQMTDLCDRQTVSAGRPVLPSHLLLGLRPPRSGVSCRGARQLRWNGSRFESDGLDEIHLARLEKLRRAMCLRGRRWSLLASKPRGYR